MAKATKELCSYCGGKGYIPILVNERYKEFNITTYNNNPCPKCSKKDCKAVVVEHKPLIPKIEII